jgi:hypothetical protein
MTIGRVLQSARELARAEQTRTVELDHLVRARLEFPT